MCGAAYKSAVAAKRLERLAEERASPRSCTPRGERGVSHGGGRNGDRGDDEAAAWSSLDVKTADRDVKTADRGDEGDRGDEAEAWSGFDVDAGGEANAAGSSGRRASSSRRVAGAFREA
mmetsp:Transcript_16272/g.56860  ORF Transcript_16272/g.56860 Transcript_16272/m.56860 type:complete len:119 (+) Transcript_16272:917-1273(+)